MNFISFIPLLPTYQVCIPLLRAVEFLVGNSPHHFFLAVLSRAMLLRSSFMEWSLEILNDHWRFKTIWRLCWSEECANYINLHVLTYWSMNYVVVEKPPLAQLAQLFRATARQIPVIPYIYREFLMWLANFVLAWTKKTSFIGHWNDVY